MGLFSGIGDLLGIGGDQGEYYKAGTLQSKGLQAQKEMLDAYGSSNVSNAGNKLYNGEDLSSLLGGLSSNERMALASSPIYANSVGSDFVRNDKLTSGMFGKGGSQEQALAEEKNLANRGYSLQPEDHEAYGQASGNIARMFGQQENDLARSLSSRGLASAPNGAAAVQFSGLQGNKNEQLAASQRQIADQRMSKNLERLGQTRNYLTNLTGAGQNALNGAVNRNMGAAGGMQSLASSLANNETNDFSAQEGVNKNSMESKLKNKKKNIVDAYAAGIYKDASGGVSGLLNGNGGGGGDTGTSTGEAAGGWSGQSVGSASGMSGGGAGKAMMLFSDRNLKENIEEVFALPVYSYTYKNSAHGVGKHVSPMAQDLEATELGRSAVVNTDEGKMVDYGKLCGLMFAQIALLSKEVAALKEGK